MSAAPPVICTKWLGIDECAEPLDCADRWSLIELIDFACMVDPGTERVLLAAAKTLDDVWAADVESDGAGS